MNQHIKSLLQAGATLANHKKVVEDFLYVKIDPYDTNGRNPLAIEAARDRHTNIIDILNLFKRTMGMTTADFTDIVTRNITLLEKKYPEPKYRKLARFARLPDFRESAILTGFDDVKRSNLPEGGEIPFTVALEDLTAKAATKRYATRILLSPESIKNNTDWISTLPMSVLESCYRDEADIIFDMLESNPTLIDTQPFFVDGKNSTNFEPSYPVGAFSQLLAEFRNQKTHKSERFLNIDPAFLVCSSEKESKLREEIKALSLENEITVIVRAGIQNNYLLADHESSPTIARLAIDDKPSVTASPVPNSSGFIAITGQFTAEFVPVSRNGIVRQTFI